MELWDYEVAKDPLLTLLAPQLAALWPELPLYVVLRHPVEQIRSVLSRLQLDGQQHEFSCARTGEASIGTSELPINVPGAPTTNTP